jgi:protein dithiol:quinone oxidoreductase
MASRLDAVRSYPMWENPAMTPTPRLVFAAIFVAAFSLIGTAIVYYQNTLGLEPCPMCILSRICFMLIGATALVAAIHGPRGKALRIYAALVALFAVTGVGISIRHSYLQHFPPAVETCGADLEFLLNTQPLAQALPKIFAGTGSCSEVAWRFLGLSIPEWALVWFVILGSAALWSAWRRPA